LTVPLSGYISDLLNAPLEGNQMFVTSTPEFPTNHCYGLRARLVGAERILKIETAVRRSEMRKASNPIFVRLLFLILISFATSPWCLAQKGFGKDSALLPESWARKSATNAVWPIYPDEAIGQGIGGVVRIRFETKPAGDVVTIKVKPGTDPRLSKAVVDAVKQWKFKPWPGVERLVPVFSRLGFHFIIGKGEPSVEYDYEPRAAICLECSNSGRSWSNGTSGNWLGQEMNLMQSLRYRFLEKTVRVTC